MPIEEQTQYDLYQTLDFAVFPSLGQRLTISNRTVTQLGFWLMKEGVGLAGDVYFEINRVSDDTLIVSKYWGRLGDANSARATYEEVTFDTPVLINEEVRIYVRVTGGTADNHLGSWVQSSDVKADEVFCRYRDFTSAWEVEVGFDHAYRYTFDAVPPTVTTDPATGVVNNSAQLNGTSDNDGFEACACGFEWGETIAYGKTTPAQSRTTGQTFAQTVYPLKSNTTYHFRAYATNSVATSYGADRSFTTPQVPHYASTILPEVDTQPATLITQHTARLNGIVIEDNGVIGATRFQWGLSTNYGNNTSWEQGYNKGDEFFVDLNNLAEGQAFHFRAQYRNQGAIYNGRDMTINTLSPLGPVTLVTDEIMQLLEAV